MNRSETIQIVRFLKPDVDEKRLTRMSPEELHGYLVHLKAIRFQELNDRHPANQAGARS